MSGKVSTCTIPIKDLKKVKQRKAAQFLFPLLNYTHQFNSKLTLLLTLYSNFYFNNLKTKNTSPNQTGPDQDLPSRFVTLLEMMQQLAAAVVAPVVEIHRFKAQHIVVYIEVFRHQAPSPAAELPVALKHYVSVMLL